MSKVKNRILQVIAVILLSLSLSQPAHAFCKHLGNFSQVQATGAKYGIYTISLILNTQIGGYRARVATVTLVANIGGSTPDQSIAIAIPDGEEWTTPPPYTNFLLIYNPNTFSTPLGAAHMVMGCDQAMTPATWNGTCWLNQFNCAAQIGW
jgi:hypothetical protein